MLLPFNAHTYMHATNRLDSYQILHLTFAQWMLSDLQPIISTLKIPKLYTYNKRIRNESYNMMPKPNQLAQM